MSAPVIPAYLAAALDRPVWSALSGAQAGLAQGTAQALRIDPAYGPFAACAPGQAAALAGLLRGGDDEIWLVERAPVGDHRLAVKREAALVQMVWNGVLPACDEAGITALGPADYPQMAALAAATQPGPWGPKTPLYGQFYGVFAGERLVAMAGVRMRPTPGITELSGVCTAPDQRGKGLAARLSARVMADLAAAGQGIYLHSWAGNAGAIRLYEQLGFAIRAEMVASVLALG